MRLKLGPLIATVVVVHGVLLFACDSDKFYPSTSGRGFPGGAGGTTFDAGNPGFREVAPSPCEEAQPKYACDYLGPPACELGDAANVRCNEVLACYGTNWRLEDAGPPCTTACPSTFTLDAPDGACEAADAPALLCEYPEGLCGCARASRLGDAAVDAETEDAGDAGDAGPYVWTCIAPNRTDGCPRTRPRLGDRCVRDVECDYGACVFDNGIVVECRGAKEGFWSQTARRTPCSPAQP